MKVGGTAKLWTSNTDLCSLPNMLKQATLYNMFYMQFMDKMDMLSATLQKLAFSNV